MQKTEEDPSDIASQEQIYQDMETEFQDVMEEDTLKDVQIKIVTFIMNELSSYSLPVTIQSVSIEEGDSQVLTVKFKNQNQKQGDIILLLHGAHQSLVIIIWIFSILCNAFWARGSRIANVEYTYFHLFRRYPTIWLAIRMLLVVMMSLFVIGYTI